MRWSADPRDEVTDYVRTKKFTPNTMLALRELINDICNEVVLYRELANVPQRSGPQLPQ